MTPILPQPTVKSAALWVCVLYALLTVTSSTVQLLQSIDHDTNLHLLARFAITVVGVGSLTIFAALQRRFRRAPTAKAAGGTCLITIAVVLILTWVFGQFESLHPDAYGDIAPASSLRGSISPATMDDRAAHESILPPFSGPQRRTDSHPNHPPTPAEGAA